MNTIEVSGDSAATAAASSTMENAAKNDEGQPGGAAECRSDDETRDILIRAIRAGDITPGKLRQIVEKGTEGPFPFIDRTFTLQEVNCAIKLCEKIPLFPPKNKTKSEDETKEAGGSAIPVPPSA